MLRGLVVAIALLGGRMLAQAPVATAFEAADVHRSPFARVIPPVSMGYQARNLYTWHQARMVDLIAAAYGTDVNAVQGGPSWLEWDRFEVVARVPKGTPHEALAGMLKGLLADRFGLVVHTGMKPMPAYVLSLGEGKPKMKEVFDSEDTGCRARLDPAPPNDGPGIVPLLILNCHNMTMAHLVQQMRMMDPLYFKVPVLDETGLTQAWDFELKWSLHGQLVVARGDGISIFDAMSKQLGLKMEMKTAPQQVLLVDKVAETPTPNPPELVRAAVGGQKFDVSTIKPSSPDGPGPGARMGPGRISPNLIDVKQTTLKMLIGLGWNLDLQDDQVLAGAPKWVESDRFDVMAKVADDTAGPGGGARDIDDLRRMVRELLAERFGLKAHMEDRLVDEYVLVAVHPRMMKADPAERTRCAEGPGPDGKDPRIGNPGLNRLETCHDMTMEQLGVLLAQTAGKYMWRPALDETGLMGGWYFTLAFSSYDLAMGPRTGATAEASDPTGAISMYDAVERQLGLKLVMKKRMGPVLVIDHVEETPTEN
jgi:uncharacterized protein (TIGR03435 family)